MTLCIFVCTKYSDSGCHLEPRQEPGQEVRQDPELPPAGQGGREEGEAGQQAEQAVIHSQHQQDLGEARLEITLLLSVRR